MSTEPRQHAQDGSPPQTIEKVSIIVSKGSLEGIYPGLIMANGARMEGIEANLFFTFFGLDAINRAKHEHVKVATVGNPGLHLATWAGGIPGVSALVTHKLGEEMEKLDIPPIPEFIEMISESGAGLYACKASVDLFGLSTEDFSAREGIKSKQLVWWRWKLGCSPSEPAAPGPPQFLPVRVVDAVACRSSVAVPLEIALPNGRVVRVATGFDAATLERVLEIASEGGSC